MNSALPQDAKPVPSVPPGYPMLYADLERLLNASDAGFEAGFLAFVRQLEAVFRAEERWLDAASLASSKVHRDLYAEVLDLLHQAQERVFEGDFGLARKVIRLLPSWFENNTPYLGIVPEAAPPAIKPPPHKASSAA